MPKGEPEVVLEVGAEGGRIALYGIRDAAGWRFFTETVDQTAWLLDEFDEPEVRKTDLVDSWEAALQLIERYPWHVLSPLTVHPEFRQLVWAAVHSRFASDRHESDDRSLEDWRRRCIGSPG